MENNSNGCINHNKNGWKNIQKEFKYYIERGERTERHRREYKLNFFYGRFNILDNIM